MKNFTMSKRFLIGAALISCTLGSIQTANAADAIRIGSILSVSGPAAFLGDPELNTLQTYIEKINAAGGVLGRKLELVHYDDGGESVKANSFAKRLIDDDRVDFLIGGTTTGSTIVMAMAI